MKTNLIQNTIAAALLTFASASVFARSPEFKAQAPKVTCELTYYRAGDQTITVGGTAPEYKVSQPVTVNLYQKNGTVLNGFTLDAVLTQVCAADGGPCSDIYTLWTSVSKGESKASNSYNIRLPAKRGERSSLALDVGNEAGHLNCDIK